MFPFFFAAAAYAQQRPEPVDPIRDQRVVNGYTVRPIPAVGGGYGYDILQDNKTVLHQFRNPLLTSLRGIAKKEDVFTIATWVIKDYQKSGKWRKLVPPNVARELKIATH